MIRVGLVQSGDLFEDPCRSARRLGALLEGTGVEAVPVRLEQSSEPRDCLGRLERDDQGWRVLASDLGVDSLTGKSRQRFHSLSAHLGILARREGFRALHALGVSGGQKPCQVAAQAAVEEDLPLLASFLDGEAEMDLAVQADEIRASLRAAAALTAPCSRDVEAVRRLFAPEAPMRILPPHVEPLGEVGPVELPCPGPVIGCLALHGRTSGLDVVLEAFRQVGASRPGSLLLAGEFDPLESFAFGPWIDRHPLSERIFRTGAAERDRGLALLRACRVALYPLATGAQVGRVLDAAAAGAPLLASPVGALEGLPLSFVEERSVSAWSRALVQALEAPPAAAPALPREYSAPMARERWLDLYREVGLCS